ncbi:hypothetical protein SDC9_185075 [bioreactor metagenome]|uniref:Uncharacterized protein n=1 Tax=bioreactor metagenome TaxID=1076179 RepID=A0A645HEU5_9ZZZZ
MHVFQVFVVSHLYFMHQIHHFFEEKMIMHTPSGSMLDASVQVDSQHTFRTGRNTSGAQCITEPIVGNLVTQPATTAQRIGIVAHIGKKRMSFRVHFSCKIPVFLVLHLSVITQQSHCFYRESQHRFRTLQVKPFHETFLKPVQRLPMRLASIREHEVLKQAIEIVTVVIRDIPENGLKVPGSGRLID